MDEKIGKQEIRKEKKKKRETTHGKSAHNDGPIRRRL